MAFFKRVMDHLLNQVLVETLANSRWFQRFAVHSHKLSKEVAEKSGRLVRRCGGSMRQTCGGSRRSCQLLLVTCAAGSRCNRQQAAEDALSEQRLPGLCRTTTTTTCVCAPFMLRAGKDHSKVLDEHVSTFMDKAKQVSAQVWG